MKKWVLLLISVVFIFTMVLVISQGSDDDQNKQNYTDISLKQYEKKLGSNDSFIFYAYSNNCEACKELKPNLDSIIKDKKQKVYGLNVQNMSESEIDKLVKRDNIQYTPTLIFYKKGEIETKEVGQITKSELNHLFGKSLEVKG